MGSEDWFSLKKGERAFSAPKTSAQKREFEKLLAYQTTRGRKKKFPMRKDVEYYFGVRWEMDLLDLGGKKSFNAPTKGDQPKRYAVICYDLFSKAVFARAIPDRQGKSVVAALSSVFKQLKPPYPKFPLEIQCDEGGEFKNEAVKKFLTEVGVNLVFVRGPRKNQSVERCIRSFKKIAVPYMEHYKNSTWPNCVRAVADFLNRRENRSTGLSPDAIASSDWSAISRLQEKLVDEGETKNFDQYRSASQAFKKGRAKKGDFVKGDWVLVAHDKTPYEKETVRNFLYKPYKIVGSSLERKPYKYYLADSSGKKAPRSYYSEEMRKIGKAHLKGNVPIAGILKREGEGKEEKWLARFVDHGKEFDRWIKAKKYENPPDDEENVPKGEKPIKQSRDKKGFKRKKAV